MEKAARWGCRGRSGHYCSKRRLAEQLAPPPPRNRLIPAPQVPSFSKGRASDTSVPNRTVSALSPTGPSQLPPSQGRWTRKTAAPDLGLFLPDPSGGSKNRLRRSFQTGSFQTGSSQAGSRLVLFRLVPGWFFPGWFQAASPPLAQSQQKCIQQHVFAEFFPLWPPQTCCFCASLLFYIENQYVLFVPQKSFMC